MKKDYQYRKYKKALKISGGLKKLYEEIEAVKKYIERADKNSVVLALLLAKALFIENNICHLRGRLRSV